VYAGIPWGTNEIADNAITTAKIKNKQVKTADLKNNAIKTIKIKDGEVKSADLASGLELTGGLTVEGPTNLGDTTIGSTLDVGGILIDSEAKVIDMNANNIENVADPTNPQDAATKAYVDSIFSCEGAGAMCDVGVGECKNSGIFICSSGSAECTVTPGNPTTEVCDTLDNDCDGEVDDVVGIGDACDGADSDLCDEGTLSCGASVLICSDSSGDNLEVCDNSDNDCNVATPDGADEQTLDESCDGPDSDLCEEGTISCTAGSLGCSDATGNNLEVCDNSDNDCNVGTPDGADETWFGNLCDGPDSDLCEEGTFQCSGGSQQCSDSTGDDVEICNGFDDDCDGSTDEGFNLQTDTLNCGSCGNECVEAQICAAGACVAVP